MRPPSGHGSVCLVLTVILGAAGLERLRAACQDRLREKLQAEQVPSVCGQCTWYHADSIAKGDFLIRYRTQLLPSSAELVSRYTC